MTNKSVLRRPLTAALTVANLCVLTFYLAGWTSTRPQEPGLRGKERMVAKGFALKAAPAEFADVKVKGRHVRLDEVFEDEADWLKGLSIGLKNKSGKAITFAVLHIDFPETQAEGRAMMMHTLVLGHETDADAALGRAPLRVGPGESLDVSLAGDFERIKRSVETRRPLDQVRKVVIRLDRVMFEDGTLYSGGALFRRNPDENSPRKWLPVSDDTAPAGAGR